MVFRVYLVFAFFTFFTVTESGQILALFTLTNCRKGFEFECSNALLNENRMVIQHSMKKYSGNVRLCTMDVENDHEKLLELILKLTEKNSPFILHCRNNTTMNYIYDDQILIFTYMSFELTRIVSSLVLLDDIFVLASITDQFMYPAYYFDHPFAIYSYEASFEQKLHRDIIKLKNGLNITYAAILNLRQSPVTNKSEICLPENDHHTAWCLYTKNCPNDCIKAKDVDVLNQKDVNYTVELLTNHSISFLILAGESLSIELFERATNLSNFFFLPYFTRISDTFNISIPVTAYKKFDVILNFTGSFAFNKFLYYVFNLKRLLLVKDYIWEGILEMKNVQEFICNKISDTIKSVFDIKCGKFTLKKWQSIPDGYKNLLIDSMMGNKIVLKSIILVWKKRCYIENLDHKLLMEQKVFYNPTKALQKKPYCELKKPLCQPGQELLHSFYKEPGWNKSLGWNCRSCPKFFYKTAFGNHENCQKCPSSYDIK